eukprot:CAMPEP_0196825244 /NCGR_PEP_ID=MMETSP1362-20130617/92938_1 /TAXON_ID=163516 /ORGANISM="Leptocylindrus danicus, Strain CCMP1856" /LENGTH=52 /DNA_ID=CAMNT_0042205631 /DNA_START=581 /DNA_END=740 /DNA_ORIENTATION=-
MEEKKKKKRKKFKPPEYTVGTYLGSIMLWSLKMRWTIMEEKKKKKRKKFKPH